MAVARACAACATTASRRSSRAAPRSPRSRASSAALSWILCHSVERLRDPHHFSPGSPYRRPAPTIGVSGLMAGRSPVDGRSMDIDFADLLMEVVSRRASDLHLSRRRAPDGPRARAPDAARGLSQALLRPTRARSSTRSSPATSASAWRPTGSSTSPTRSPATPASASTPTSSAARSAPPSA